MPSQIHEYGVIKLGRSNPRLQEQKEVTSSEIGGEVPVVLFGVHGLNRGLLLGPASLLAHLSPRSS